MFVLISVFVDCTNVHMYSSVCMLYRNRKNYVVRALLSVCFRRGLSFIECFILLSLIDIVRCPMSAPWLTSIADLPLRHTQLYKAINNR